MKLGFYPKPGFGSNNHTGQAEKERLFTNVGGAVFPIAGRFYYASKWFIIPPKIRTCRKNGY